MVTPSRAEGPSTSSQFEQLLSAIRGMEANVDTKLSMMHKELREERETAYEHLVKKIRLDLTLVMYRVPVGIVAMCARAGALKKKRIQILAQ